MTFPRGRCNLSLSGYGKVAESLLGLRPFFSLSVWFGLEAQTPPSAPPVSDPPIAAGAPQVLTTVAQIRALSPGEVARALPVEVHAVITYYQPEHGQIFVQDATGGIFVMPPAHAPSFQPGDTILIRGTTLPSFAADITAADLRFEKHAQFPMAVPVTWHELLDKKNDCRYVSITGKVRSATREQFLRPALGSAGHPRSQSPPVVVPGASYILMDLQTDGGPVRVHMDDDDPGMDPHKLLDSEIKIAGTDGGIFDGKFQQIGVQLWVATTRHLQVLRRASGDPAALPLSDIRSLITDYSSVDLSRRVHVRGSITFDLPGLALVVETPQQEAVLVRSYEQSPFAVGQVVDVLGFPNPGESSEVIRQASVVPTSERQNIQPVPISWDEAIAGRYPYDLISMDGQLAAEVHERHQDTVIIRNGTHVFSAILPRTVWNQLLDQPSLPDYRIGSMVRITGVCFVYAGGPWDTTRWFDVEMRSPQDLLVLSDPSWWTVRHLFYLSAALLAMMIAAFVWAVMLHRKVRKQSEQIRLRIEAEAARERRVAMVARERSRVLEAINSMQDLEEVLLMILRLVSNQLDTAACWCELASEVCVGTPEPAAPASLISRREILNGAGEVLGTLVLAGADLQDPQSAEALDIAASLAALAIDNRRLYETLVHRSQYDQLTNAANRFLLESRLDEVLAQASRNRTHFALIYLDLDDFKQVNDHYGHRAGDALLQQVTERISANLRTMDTLARVGGDEFIALIPVVRHRAEVEEIAQRLLRAFEIPFEFESRSLRQSASLGIAVFPEDGVTKDDLKRVADSAMYVSKSGVPR